MAADDDINSHDKTSSSPQDDHPLSEEFRNMHMNGELNLPPSGVITTHCVSSVIPPGRRRTSGGDPLQFVKIQATDLSKKAQEQIRLAEEEKITKEKIKEVEEEWQSNLLNWKSKRRVNHVPTDEEQENNDSDDKKGKIKTFSEILNEKKKLGQRIGYNLSRYVEEEEDANDFLKDLIPTGVSQSLRRENEEDDSLITQKSDGKESTMTGCQPTTTSGVGETSSSSSSEEESSTNAPQVDDRKRNANCHNNNNINNNTIIRLSEAKTEKDKNVWNYLLQQNHNNLRIHADDVDEDDDEDEGQKEEEDSESRVEQLINFRAKLSAFENLSRNGHSRDTSSSASSTASSGHGVQGQHHQQVSNDPKSLQTHPSCNPSHPFAKSISHHKHQVVSTQQTSQMTNHGLTAMRLQASSSSSSSSSSSMPNQGTMTARSSSGVPPAHPAHPIHIPTSTSTSAQLFPSFHLQHHLQHQQSHPQNLLHPTHHHSLTHLQASSSSSAQMMTHPTSSSLSAHTSLPVLQQQQLPSSNVGQPMPPYLNQQLPPHPVVGYNKNHWLIQEAELRRQIQASSSASATTNSHHHHHPHHLNHHQVGGREVLVLTQNSSHPQQGPSSSSCNPPPPPQPSSTQVTWNDRIYENVQQQQQQQQPQQPVIPIQSLVPVPLMGPLPPPTNGHPTLLPPHPPPLAHHHNHQQQHHPHHHLPQQQKQNMLSVSGRKKCSSCSDELGRGCAAMVIESLSLYFHINCFRCSVCHVKLGNGTCGTDVRVRNHKLHCNNCYSNDEVGLKFSRV